MWRLARSVGSEAAGRTATSYRSGGRCLQSPGDGGAVADGRGRAGGALFSPAPPHLFRSLCLFVTNDSRQPPQSTFVTVPALRGAAGQFDSWSCVAGVRRPAFGRVVIAIASCLFTSCHKRNTRMWSVATLSRKNNKTPALAKTGHGGLARTAQALTTGTKKKHEHVSAARRRHLSTIHDRI